MTRRAKGVVGAVLMLGGAQALGLAVGVGVGLAVGSVMLAQVLGVGAILAGLLYGLALVDAAER